MLIQFRPHTDIVSFEPFANFSEEKMGENSEEEAQNKGLHNEVNVLLLLVI